jgi:hypothetical protein
LIGRCRSERNSKATNGLTDCSGFVITFEDAEGAVPSERLGGDLTAHVLPRRRFAACLWRVATVALLTLALPALLSRSEPVRAAQVLHLPYPAGLAVNIIQGYNAVTHVGVERYSLDLVRVDGKTSGSPVIAPASGTVAFAEVPGTQTGCIGVSMDDSGDFHYMLCHIILDHTYNYGDRIQVGQYLGTVGAPGLVGNNGTAHIHMQLYTLPGGQRTPEPYAPPNGIPLEGVSMPADGSFDQWACPSSACGKLVSAAPGGTPAVLSSSPGGQGTPTSAPAAPSPALIAGDTAVVNDTGDCLKVHAQPSLSAVSTGCIPDGTDVLVGDGPRQSDGHTWWDLQTLGWAVADYLAPVTAPAAPASPASIAPPLGAGTAPAAAPTPPAVGVGATVKVTGTGDCLRIHAEPSLASASATCLPDGTSAVVQDGPVQADRHTWWLLNAGGWAVGDYLQAES